MGSGAFPIRMSSSRQFTTQILELMTQWKHSTLIPTSHRNVVLRTATPQDRSAIIALINRVCSEKKHLQTLRYKPSPQWEHLLKTGYDPQEGMWLGVATYNRAIIGFGRVFADASHTNRRPTGNVGLVLQAGWRHRGVGSLLLEKVIALAQEMGYAYLRADILTVNQASLHLFRKFGFEAIDTHRMYWEARDIYTEEVIMERCIMPTLSSFAAGCTKTDGGHEYSDTRNTIY